MTPETSIYEYAKQALNVSADKPAIWFHDKSMTYRELFEKIDNVADHLAQLGVKEGTVVTIHLPNCPQAVIAIYAVAKLGAICNMVHPQMPEEALKQYLYFTESDCLISSDLKLLNQNSVRCAIHVDTISFEQSSQVKPEYAKHILSFAYLSNHCHSQAIIPEQSFLADKCVVYMHSSGTTGISKTVMMSHKAINLWVENLKSHYCGDLLREQVSLGILPLYHTFGLFHDMHRILSYGGQLVMMQRWNCNEAIQMIKSYKVTYLSGTPSIYQSLLQHSEFAGNGISQISYCIVAGENVPTNLVCELDNRIGNGVVTFCAYGLSEVCGAVCAQSPDRRKLTTSGYPLDNTVVMVRDSNGEMHTTGKGELIVSTDSMMLGYLKDPKATEEACLHYNNKVWLKTGDYGEIDDEGYITCLGRLKEIIIRKGNNVFPSEVEKIIQQIPEVEQICVIGTQDKANTTETVCALVVLQPNVDEEKAKSYILKKCSQFLPKYAIPERIIFLAQLPHNIVGKMDRNALKEIL